MTAKRKLIYWLCGLLIVVASQLSGRLALAHAELDHANPAAGAVLTTPPTQVQIWFTEELFRRKGVNAIAVYGADGSRQDQGDVTINDDDRTLMRVALKPDLPPGVYTVRWQAVSSDDGHESSGEFTFTIGASGAPAATAAATPTAMPLPVATPTSAPAPTVTPPPTTGTGLPCLGGAAPLLLVVGVLWLRRRPFSVTP